MGTGPCSDPLWVACVCSVPGVTSVKMPEPGKKTGSSRPGDGLSVGHGGLGASTIEGAGLGSSERILSSWVLFWLSVSPSRPFDESEGEPGPGTQRGGSQGRKILGSPLTLRREKDPSLPQPLSPSAARLGLACLLGKGRCRQAPRLSLDSSQAHRMLLDKSLPALGLSFPIYPRRSWVGSF